MAGGTVRFSCPGCGKQGIAGRDEIGKEVTCPDDNCATVFAIPEPKFRVTGGGKIATKSEATVPTIRGARKRETRARAQSHIAHAVELLNEGYVPNAVALQLTDECDLSPTEAKAVVKKARALLKADETEKKREHKAESYATILVGLVLIVIGFILGVAGLLGD